MADNQNQYEADEFDQLAAQRQTYGAHRIRRRKYGWIIAFVAILVIAPVAGVLGGQLLTQSDKAQELLSQSESENSQSQEATTGDETERSDQKKQQDDHAVDSQQESQSAQVEPSEESPETQVQTTQPEQTAPEPVINQAAPVSVLNAAGIQGLAREKAQILRNAGFTQVSADNYQGNQVTRSIIYYGDAASADTANKVAADLGISAVEENSNIARAGSIVVILATR